MGSSYLGHSAVAGGHNRIFLSEKAFGIGAWTSWTQSSSHPFMGDNRQVAFTIKPSGSSVTPAEAWTNRLSDDDGGPDKLQYHRQV